MKREGGKEEDENKRKRMREGGREGERERLECESQQEIIMEVNQERGRGKRQITYKRRENEE
jgi:hypothetical protein